MLCGEEGDHSATLLIMTITYLTMVLRRSLTLLIYRNKLLLYRWAHGFCLNSQGSRKCLETLDWRFSCALGHVSPLIVSLVHFLAPTPDSRGRRVHWYPTHWDHIPQVPYEMQNDQINKHSQAFKLTELRGQTEYVPHHYDSALASQKHSVTLARSPAETHTIHQPCTNKQSILSPVLQSQGL